MMLQHIGFLSQIKSNQIKTSKNMSSLPPPDSKVPSKFSNVSKKIWGSSRSSLGAAGSVETHDEIKRRGPLFVQKSEAGNVMLPKVAVEMKPKIVMLKVSMHCNGCATKVEKHISKLEGVSAFKVDLESKMVVIIGENIVPVEVLESVSRIRRAEFLG